MQRRQHHRSFPIDAERQSHGACHRLPCRAKCARHGGLRTGYIILWHRREPAVLCRREPRPGQRKSLAIPKQHSDKSDGRYSNKVTRALIRERATIWRAISLARTLQRVYALFRATQRLIESGRRGLGEAPKANPAVGRQKATSHPTPLCHWPLRTATLLVFTFPIAFQIVPRAHTARSRQGASFPMAIKHE